jgi:predicted AlkP superfamily pyrophosphatase or phosphodiesterase
MRRYSNAAVSSWVAGALALAACAPRNCPSPALPAFCQTGASAPVTVTGSEASRPIQRVVLVSIDGLKPEAYLQPDPRGLKIPTLRWMMQRGAKSDGVLSVFPSLTYPAHTTMATGASPGRHHIVANRSFDPDENDLDGWRWYAEDIAVRPLWQVAEERGLDTALIHWPVSVGAAVKWNVPEYWRASNRQDQKLLRAVSTPGLLKAVAAESPEFWSRYPPPNVMDDALTDIALHVLTVGQPRLLLLHLVEVDAAQHRFGVDSPEALQAIEKDDAQVARILEALGRLGLQKDAALVVASDHGFRSAPQVVRPCTLLTEDGLIAVEGGRIVSWKATVHAHAGEAYVYVKEPSDQSTRERVRQLFEAKRTEPGSGIARLYESAEIRQLGGDPEAFLFLGAGAEFQFGSGCLGDYRVPSKYRASHGFDPRDEDMRASLLMVGPGIPHGTISEARLIDIAPTIAKWLGLELPEAEGTALRIVPAP